MNGLLNHLVLTLKLNFRSKQAIIYGYVVPIFFLFALGSVFASKPPLKSDMGRLLTVTILGGACFGMPTTMVAERERGVWRRFRLLPTATAGIIISAMAARFLIVLSAAVMQILLAHYLPMYKTDLPAHPLGMLGAFVFVCFAFLGLGLVIAMLADNVPAVQAMGQAIFLPLIIIGGVGFKLEALPQWAQHVANFLPGRYAVDALQACQNGQGLAAAKFNLLSLTIIGLAALLAGAKLFRWDVGQKIAGSARGWVAVAVVGWLGVGVAAEYPAWKEKLRTQHNASVVTGAGGAGQSVEKIPSPLMPAPIAVSRPAPIVQKQPWELLTAAQIDAIQYDDLPDDNGTVIPLAPDLNGLDDDGRKRMEALNDALADWPPAKVQDVPQCVRYLLSICAVADVAQDQNEAHIPYVIFNYMRGNIQKDRLIKALAWVILNPMDGAVLTDVKDLKELSLDAVIQEGDVRERSTAYAKKFLIRLLDKMPKKPL